MSTKLTKKQQKAAAFRSGEYKTKDKKPAKANVGGKDSETKSKKRKRGLKADDNVDDQDDKEEIDISDDEEITSPEKDAIKKTKNQNQSSVAKKVKLSDESKDDTESQNATDKKSRFILFVGNLPFDVGVDDIKGHFTDKKSAAKGPSSVRLLTTKTNGKGPAKSKGCAFLEFTNPAALQRALEYHHTEYNGRKINVELSAGGGGNSQERREKIRAKNEVVDKERAEALEKKKTEKAKTLETSANTPPSAIHASRAALIKQQASQAKRSLGGSRTPAKSINPPKRSTTGPNAISLSASSR